MTTQLGKALKKLRIDHEERLMDMAAKLSRSASFLSAVEVGKKAPPTGFEDEVIRAYNLNEEIAAPLRQAADYCRKVFTLKPESSLGRDTAGLMARRMNSLSDQQLMEIKKILNRD